MYEFISGTGRFSEGGREAYAQGMRDSGAWDRGLLDECERCGREVDAVELCAICEAQFERAQDAFEAKREVEFEAVQDAYWAVMVARSKAKRCPRHGESLEGSVCWECSMEWDVAKADREDARRAA